MGSARCGLHGALPRLLPSQVRGRPAGGSSDNQRVKLPLQCPHPGRPAHFKASTCVPSCRRPPWCPRPCRAAPRGALGPRPTGLRPPARARVTWSKGRKEWEERGAGRGPRPWPPISMRPPSARHGNGSPPHAGRSPGRRALLLPQVVARGGHALGCPGACRGLRAVGWPGRPFQPSSRPWAYPRCYGGVEGRSPEAGLEGAVACPVCLSVIAGLSSSFSFLNVCGLKSLQLGNSVSSDCMIMARLCVLSYA